MDVKQISADIAGSLVATNEFSGGILDYRDDGAGGILVDVYDPDLDENGAVRVLHTYRVNIVLTEPDGTSTAKPEPAVDDVATAYAAALDEIYALRTGAAYEAALLEQVLALKTFPTGCRQATRQQQERLRLSARGETGAAYQAISDFDLRVVRTQAGMSQLLTRYMFEEGPRDRK